VVTAVRAAPSRMNAATNRERTDESAGRPLESGTAAFAPPRPSPSSEARQRPTHVEPTALAAPALRPIVAEARLAVPRAPRESQTAAAEGPAVQVTIGRVEIRATVASAPTRPPAPNKPPLSLDEYLKQRSGATR
jgi:hypothetical protein